MRDFHFMLPLLAAITLGSAPARAQNSPQILINGADEDLTINIRNHLRVATEACDTALVRLRRLLPRVQTNIRRAAHALGYYRSEFTSVFSADANCWRLDIQIEPGDRISVGEVSIHIDGVEETLSLFRDVLDETPVQPGVPLNHGEYESLKNALSALAVENGYFSARFDQAEIRLDLTAYRADIVLDFVPGPRYRFGQIRILPVAGLSDAFIRSLILIQTGESYSSERLLEQRRNLDESMYFSHVSVSPRLAQTGNTSVPVIIELQVRPRHAWSTGIGFTTDTGPRIRASYENRYINSRGHLLESDTALSTVRSQVNLGYEIPLDDPVHESISVGGGFITENTDAFDSDRFKLETAYRVENASGWLESWSVDFLRDDFVVDLQEDTAVLTMLGYSLGRTEADNLINPEKGWRLFAQLRGASDTLLSDATFLQFYSSGKGVLSFGDARLISRFEVGTTWIDDPDDLPASVRYFAGGDQSLRGYKYRTLGPVNSNDEVIGGAHLLTGSVEMDYRVKSNWRAALFYDGGNAFSNEDFDWKHAVGIGVRWLSPIGPIRADLAHALSDEGGFRLHITMGPDL